MLALQNFFRMGVHWVGPDADKLRSRRVRVVLEHLARKVKPDRPHAGVRLIPADLADDLYTRRNAAYALADLVKVGVIVRERSRVKKSLHEEVALTHIHPDLIAAAGDWNRAKGALRRCGKRSGNVIPPKVEIDVLNLQNALKKEATNCCLEKAPDLPLQSGNPHEIRADDVAVCKKCSPQPAKNAETGCSTPPLEVSSACGDLAPAVLEPAVAGDNPQPATAGVWGGSGSSMRVQPQRSGPRRQSQLEAAMEKDALYRVEKERLRFAKKIELETI